ncbi:MAG: hypothetical protein UX25_C0016G0009 [Candidatus Woesebacteria bacterium GW2011_GWC2_45_9]|uniref:Uncharacterized protein n=2 Tax=Microgenomates group TaxID=1794810 RepID=A0A0G1R885_9BACT|nr:MAG: hypothetical protein UW61_C0006G0008 [Candidatus Curtissbacteria bacterium GW2011_GWC1_44_33]KKU17105.1 MAG: hypothetical protein UX25_C0016G0009 [Candidatus Woesebacteria bacterium GW2011_GWC2_45_9]
MKKRNRGVSKWVAISGSWAYATKKEEKDVRNIVRKILVKGKGIVTGGALNADSFATDEAMKLDPNCRHIKIFLPTTLSIYSKHYRKRAKEGVITEKQAEDLIAQLKFIFKANPSAIIENKTNKIVDKKAYFKRNTDIVKAADELISFHVIESTGGGTLDTIEKAKKRGISIKSFSYSIDK